MADSRVAQLIILFIIGTHEEYLSGAPRATCQIISAELVEQGYSTLLYKERRSSKLANVIS